MQPIIQERQAVLVLREATLTGAEPESQDTMTINLELHVGELALIHVDHLRRAATFADLCTGLIEPTRGSVSFLGRNWIGLPVQVTNGLRGRIGRIFAAGSWLGYLTILENILLRPLHHTARPLTELRADAVRLAEHFGLPGLPTGYPQELEQGDLQRAACVRAFLGNPSLVLLEEPTAGLYPELLSPVINAIEGLRRRGGAAVWLTTERSIWMNRSLPATRRYRLAGRQFIEAASRP